MALPDISASCDPRSPNNVGERYAAWWNTYVAHHHRQRIGVDEREHTFMTGDDCYYLRCVFLHQGIDTLQHNQVRRTVERFYFVQPEPGSMIHRNQVNEILQLQVDMFCDEICQGVEAWLKAEGQRSEVAERIDKLMKIDSAIGGVTIPLLPQPMTSMTARSATSRKLI
ncbi:hypothetical protein ACPCHT_35935 [Nucisporomicrobium flavum]|uniref:hypothetical protein n=1 Tax=Nucisporomicrobium flavum TaxID=2785915 RepID=UPI003C2F4408